MTKDSFIKTLKEQGYNIDYTQNSVPTIFVNTITDLQAMIEKLPLIQAEFNYNQSISIKLQNTLATANI